MGADALTSAGARQAFNGRCTQVLINPALSTDTFDAVQSAASDASDVLLLHYSGRGAWREQFVTPAMACSYRKRALPAHGGVVEYSFWS
ncbi:hypothetical protein [Rugosimonospora acidiphila]|uniref:hypothetical protein n=1 Tax=Rugosimonospora acidiphila TaxID=556531 RepID=UPI0031E928A6